MSDRKKLWCTVWCPKCSNPKRAKMSPLRLFGTQKCDSCGHLWIPPRRPRLFEPAPKITQRSLLE